MKFSTGSAMPLLKQSGIQKISGNIREGQTSPSNKGRKIHVWSCWNERASKFARQVENTGSTLFQGELWLSCWYEIFTQDSETTAVIVAVEDLASSELLMLLPLCRRRENGLSTITFADFGLADYNAPLISPRFTPDRQEMKKLMQEIGKALPPADIIKLEKMPDRIGRTVNPMTLPANVHHSSLRHYGVEISGSWNDYWNSLKRNFRKDQRRRWRVLEKQGKVSFLHCQDARQALELFETLIRQQRQRLQGLGLPYLMEQPRMKKFYQTLLKKGCPDKPVIFTALLVDEQPVATLLGFGNGTQYAMTLSGNEQGKWARCSPGRLLTERTMQALHEMGYSYFDFTIGDEDYKKYFTSESQPLNEFCLALSWKALPHYSWMKVKASQRGSELALSLKKLLRDNTGRP